MAASSKVKNTEDIRHVLTGEEFRQTKDIALVQAVHPIYVSLKIFGLLWQDKEGILRKKFCTLNLTTVHCCIVLLSAWFNALRFFASYDSSDTYGSTLFRKIFLHLVNLQMAFGITANVYYKQKHIRSFLLIWENYKLEHGGLAFKEIKRNIMIRLLSINLVVLVITTVYTIVIAIKEPMVLSEQHFVILRVVGADRPTWLIILYMIWINYLVLAWVQSWIFCICMNKNLCGEFGNLARDFSYELSELDDLRRDPTKLNYLNLQSEILQKQSKNRIEHYRQRYLELCEIVNRYDDVISTYLLSIYIFTIPAIILLVYGLFGVDNDSLQDTVSYYVISTSSLAFYVFVAISVTGSASSIKTAAQKPQRILHSVDLSSCSIEEAISTQVFLHKITSDHVGLTVWKFLDIDKKMLVTIFTIVITYLTILLKFALALGSPKIVQQLSAEDCPCLNFTNPS